MTEQQLIQDCRQGVKSSQYLLVKRYAGMLLSVCRRYARDEEMAKDVLQETLIRIFENIGNYRPTGSFEGWMRRIAIRRALQWLEKSCFQHELHPVELPDKETSEPEIWQQLNEQEILQLVIELPPGYRAVFNLYVVEGYDHAEIAGMLDISENTSRSQLTRSKKMLQKKLAALQKGNRYEVAIVRR